jgi:NDP-sugar pyrophosphorylase family protein
MKAVILAGGRGTRLMPYTTILPKALLPVGDTPIVDVIVRQLAHQGFSEITLCVGHLAELIEAYFRSEAWRTPPARLSFVREPHALGTAGPLALVPGLSETFLLMNGDVLTTLEYRALVEHHRTCDSALTIAVVERRSAVEYGVIDVGEGERVVAYVEKPEAVHLASTGIYVCEPRVVAGLEPGVPVDLPQLVERLIARGERVSAFRFAGYWRDVGHPADYAVANGDFARDPSRFLPGPRRPERDT